MGSDKTGSFRGWGCFGASADCLPSPFPNSAIFTVAIASVSFGDIVKR